MESEPQCEANAKVSAFSLGGAWLRRRTIARAPVSICSPIDVGVVVAQSAPNSNVLQAICNA